MLETLKSIENKYNEICRDLADPDVYSDLEKVTQLSKEKNNLEEVNAAYQQLKQIKEDINVATEMLKDKEMEIFAREELENLEKKQEELKEKIKILLIPKDPNDEKNVIMEIRGAAGGDEANIFAGDLFRMYSKYIEHNGFKLEILNSVPGESGGYAGIEFMVKGEGVYSKLKYESGAHRVQRVPETESGGRVHTSTATVLVMPEAKAVDVKINPNDLKIDVYRSGGAGGQSVNTTDSAVRITHLPTNIVVTCQNERSQIKNKEKAMTILQSRIYDLKLKEQEEKLGADRKQKIGTGDRSEKIRTYNYPQNRVTDHRINLSVMNLEKVMDGDLDEIINALISEDQKRKIENIDA